MKRGSQPGHELLGMEQPHDRKLQQPQTAVEKDHYRKGNRQKHIPRFQHEDAQKQSDGPAACIAHHQHAGGGVEQQVGAQTAHKNQGAYAPQGLIQKPVQSVACGAQRNGGKGAEKAVHTVGTVAAVDKGPQHKYRQNKEHPSGQQQSAAEQRETVGPLVGIHKGDHRHQADGQIQQPLFQFAPGQFAAIVQIPGEHGRQSQKQIHRQFPGKGEQHQTQHRKHRDEHHPGAPGFAPAFFSVYGIGTAVILGQLVPQEQNEQYCQQQGSGIAYKGRRGK